MAEGHDHQDETERDERIAHSQAEKKQRAGYELDERNRDADEPERPDRQESVRKGEEIFFCMPERAQLKHFRNAGHEKNQAENESREEQGPRTVKTRGHAETSAGIYRVCTSDFEAGAEFFAGAGDGGAGARLFKTCRYCALFSVH